MNPSPLKMLAHRQIDSDHYLVPNYIRKLSGNVQVEFNIFIQGCFAVSTWSNQIGPNELSQWRSSEVKQSHIRYIANFHFFEIPPPPTLKPCCLPHWVTFPYCSHAHIFFPTRGSLVKVVAQKAVMLVLHFRPFSPDVCIYIEVYVIDKKLCKCESN